MPECHADWGIQITESGRSGSMHYARFILSLLLLLLHPVHVFFVAIACQ